MKVLVTGVAGQLGHDVMNELHSRGMEAVGSDLAPVYQGIADGSAVTFLPYVPMDITDEAQVQSLLKAQQPDAVIHCAAWTAVDAAEDPANQDKVHRINAEGTRNIAAACREIDAKILYLSTDYVFDGQGETPWDPDCKAYAPLNVYGQSKLDGELAVSSALDRYFIVRIAWVFGKNGNNFIKTMLRVAKTHKALRVVCDQIGTPTYTYDLARLLCDMISTDRYGYYHATNAELSPVQAEGSGAKAGYISWYDFTLEIFRQATLLGLPGYGTEDLTVTPVTTEEYGVSVAKRPFNSRLEKRKLTEQGFSPLPDWQDALKRYLKEMLELEKPEG